jgi:hypothetical protein
MQKNLSLFTKKITKLRNKRIQTSDYGFKFLRRVKQAIISNPFKSIGSN